MPRVCRLRIHPYLCGSFAVEMKSAAMTDNPMGTDGFEFVEFTAPDPAALGKVFESLGFRLVGRHRSKQVTQFRQGDINFIVNAEPKSKAEAFAAKHGPSACAMAFRVKHAAAAYKRALTKGARPYTGRAGPMELHIPAIEGIGGSALYLVDRYGGQTTHPVGFLPPRGEHGPGGRQAAARALPHHCVQERLNH